VSLGGQSVSLAIYQLGLAPVADLYCDLAADGVPIVNCRRCRAYAGGADEAPPFLLLDSRYLGFEGDFLFVDTIGDADPQAAGLGTRWQLLYFAPSDLAAIGDPTQQAVAA
jgi:hypothetical protein